MGRRLAAIPRAGRLSHQWRKPAAQGMGCRQERCLEGIRPGLRLVLAHRGGKQGVCHHGGRGQADQAGCRKAWWRRRRRRVRPQPPTARCRVQVGDSLPQCRRRQIAVEANRCRKEADHPHPFDQHLCHRNPRDRRRARLRLLWHDRRLLLRPGRQTALESGPRLVPHGSGLGHRQLAGPGRRPPVRPVR